ncbi:MAG: response regulator [Bacteroidota bacterium]
MKKILVIDDTLHLLDEVRDILEMEGFEVATAPNAIKGLGLIQTYQPDLIITDLHMPELNGFDLIKKVKSDQNMASLPIVVLSAKADKEALQKAKGLGAEAYIKKPCTADELISSVTQTLA